MELLELLEGKGARAGREGLLVAWLPQENLKHKFRKGHDRDEPEEPSSRKVSKNKP